jgi:coatomer protein complex subunit alpha (xenin)
VPREGDSAEKHWADTSNIAAFHFAAGSFHTALDLLQRQVGLVDATPLEALAVEFWASAHASAPSWAQLPSSVVAVTTPPPASELRAKHLPRVPALLPTLKLRVRDGLQAMTDGRFADAHAAFVSVLHTALVTVCEAPEEAEAVRQAMATAREYLGALAVEAARKAEAGNTTAPNVARILELAAYFTNFRLHHEHLVRTLGLAMVQARKNKHLKLAAQMARRMLDQDPSQEKVDQARRVIAEADKTPPAEAAPVAVDYDDRNPFVVCSVDLRPLYRGKGEPVRCTLCAAPAHAKHSGAKCTICGVAKYGGDVAGLQNLLVKL